MRGGRLGGGAAGLRDLDDDAMGVARVQEGGRSGAPQLRGQVLHRLCAELPASCSSAPPTLLARC
jgi:hypothetical protein